MTLRVEAAEGRSGRKRFERMADGLFGNEPAFVPPFPGGVARQLAPGSAFQRVHGEIHPLIAWRGGRAVGRVAAIVNRTHNARYGDTTGFFGFFECEDNPETAAALIKAVADVLRGKGLDVIRGPYNPSINDECGLLVEGFEHPPVMGLTWNPEYYERLLLEAGFSRIWESYGFHLPLHKLEPPGRLERLAKRVAERSGMILRPINLAKLEEELEIVRAVYNQTLERNWGFVPISMEDLLCAAEDLRTIADPAMILIAERNGEPAGVALSLPNFNEILHRTKRSPHWLRPLQVLWLMKTRRIRSGRQVIYGILPQFRDRGLHAWLLHEQWVRAKERFHYAELGWIEDTNSEILENSAMVGGVRYRRWRIYERGLA